MKLSVKRDQYKTFEKAMIEIDTSLEWTYLSLGLKYQIEDAVKAIEFYEGLMADGEDCTKDLKYQLERKEKLERMYEILENKNETEWIGK